MKFSSAYSQLQASEREFVDGFTDAVIRENAKQPLERLIVTLERLAAKIDLQSLDSRARDMFAKPMVCAAIRERGERLSEERDLLSIRIIREHEKIAFANMDDYMKVGEDGIPEPDFTRVNRDQWAAVQSLDYEEEYARGKTVKRVKFKLYPKQSSLDTLAKWNGLTKEENAEFVSYRGETRDIGALPANTPPDVVATKYAERLAKFNG